MCKPSHAQHRHIFTGEGTFGVNMARNALGYGGWSSDDPTCKTTAAKFTKCLEFKSVSHLSLAQTNQKQPVCTRVEVRSPPATFVPGIVNTVLSFSALSYRSHTSDNYVLQPNHSSR